MTRQRTRRTRTFRIFHDLSGFLGIKVVKSCQHVMFFEFDHRSSFLNMFHKQLWFILIFLIFSAGFQEGKEESKTKGGDSTGWIWVVECGGYYWIPFDSVWFILVRNIKEPFCRRKSIWTKIECKRVLQIVFSFCPMLPTMRMAKRKTKQRRRRWSMPGSPDGLTASHLRVVWNGEEQMQ